jgi:hypothetical protein
MAGAADLAHAQAHIRPAIPATAANKHSFHWPAGTRRFQVPAQHLGTVEQARRVAL